MKDTKRLLFENMTKLNPGFKSNLNEARIYVKASEVPVQIINWAKALVGKGFENKITVEKAEGKVTIGMPWHDADRETHQFFKLTDNGAEEAGRPVARSGWSEVNMGDKYGTVEIPSGFVLATVGTYPKRLEIITNADAMNMISNHDETLNKLSDDDMVALNNATSLKPAYRQKFADNVYQELMALGLLNSQKAVTIDGRNLIRSPEAIERLRKIKEKDQAENGWSTKYKITL